MRSSASTLDPEQGLLDPARLVFLDETAVTTSMVRLRGRAPRGMRVIGRVPLGAWKTITFIAAMRHDKMTAPMAFEGAMTGEVLLAYLEQCLCPTLRRGDIVVIDNCRAHISPRVREVIEKAGATLRYLPKYSPDSTRSRWFTANSRNSFVAPKRERLWRSGEQFARSCRASVLKNAQTTSAMRDMFPYDREPL